MGLALQTDRLGCYRAAETSYGTTSFSDPADTTTEPTTSTSILILKPMGNSLIVYPFGTDAANETFDMRFYIVEREYPAGYVSSSTGLITYSYTPILELECTLGTKTGVTNGVTSTSEFWADTLAEDATNQFNWRYKLHSNGQNLKAGVEIDHVGPHLVGVIFDLTGAASANFCYRWF